MDPAQKVVAQLKSSVFAKYLKEDQLKAIELLYANADEVLTNTALNKISSSETNLQQKVEQIEKEESEKAADNLYKTMNEIHEERKQELKEKEKQSQASEATMLLDIDKQLLNI